MSLEMRTDIASLKVIFLLVFYVEICPLTLNFIKISSGLLQNMENLGSNIFFGKVVWKPKKSFGKPEKSQGRCEKFLS